MARIIVSQSQGCAEVTSAELKVDTTPYSWEERAYTNIELLTLDLLPISGQFSGK